MTFFCPAATSADTPASGSSIAQAPKTACQTKPIAASDDSCVQQELDEGVDYFSVQGALARERLVTA